MNVYLTDERPGLPGGAGRAVESPLRLQDPEHGLTAGSHSDASVTPVLGDRFVRVDYTSAYSIPEMTI
jgi:hypothetical protein